jgi:hypothetical protein
MAAVPTPLPPPCTSTVSPAWASPSTKRFENAVTNTSMKAPASSSLNVWGVASTVRASVTTSSA